MIDLGELISFLVFCGLSKIAHVHFLPTQLYYFN